MTLRYYTVDILKFLALLGLTFILVYFLPTTGLTRVFFLFLLPVIYFSKNDFLWLAWTFVIVDAPGFLFKGGLVDDPYRLPIYTLSQGFSISFIDLVIIVFVLKILIKYRYIPPIIFKKQFQSFLLIFIFYVFITLIFFDFNIGRIFRVTIPWTFVFIAYALIKNEESSNRFNNLIFLTVFFVVAAQFHSFISGEHLVNLFKPDEFHIKSHLAREVTETSEKASRTLYSMFLIFYSTIISLINIYKKNKSFSKVYLYIVLTFSFIACILTGTRGYLLGISFIILMSMLVQLNSTKRLVNVLLIVIILPLVFYLLQAVSPVFTKQLSLVTERFSTMVLLIEGDLTAGGTVVRITERVPVILEVIKTSPLIGYGFSNTYFDNADGDVGFFTNLLNTGAFGVIILYFVFYSILKTIQKTTKKPHFIHKYGNIGSIFIIGFIGIQFFHFTTNVAFGLIPVAEGGLHERYLIYGLLFASVNTLVINSNLQNT